MIFSSIDVKKSILIVAILNFGYFFVEFFMALHIDSVSLFADSIDFLEDAFTNFLILIGLYLGWKSRMRIGYLLIALIFIPSAFTLYYAVMQFMDPRLPQAFTLSTVAFFALIVNLFCALLMVRFKNNESALLVAAFYSARNDALANIGMIIAGFLTLYTASHYPDLVVGIGIFLLNLDASKAIYAQMKKEKTLSMEEKQ